MPTEFASGLKTLGGRILSGIFVLAKMPFVSMGAARADRRAGTIELGDLRAAVAKFGADLVPRCAIRLALNEISARRELYEAAHAGDAQRVAEVLAQPVFDFDETNRAQRQWFENGALRGAAKAGHRACVELLAPRCDPNAADGLFQRDALMEAAANGQAECVAALLPWANPLRISEQGQTALIRAARAESVDCVRLLAPHSDARVADENGNTALMAAAGLGSAECVRLLMPHSDASAVDDKGYTALMLATLNNHRDCVAALLPASDPNARNPCGDTAMDIAIRWGYAECADLMAPHAQRQAAEEAFRKLGPAGMPRWHAQIEAEALRQTLRDCASSERREADGDGHGPEGETRGGAIAGVQTGAGDQPPQPPKARGATKRL